MTLILQHYWQPLNTCPKAVWIRGTQTAVKRVSLGQEGESGVKWTLAPIILPQAGKRATWQRQRTIADDPATSPRATPSNSKPLAACQFFMTIRCLAYKMEHQGCDTFSVSPHLPQGCTLLAAGYLPRSVIELWVSMTRLDDLDNAGAEEDDSCQGTVKLAFLPSSFLHRVVSRGKKLSVLTLHPSCKHLLLVYLHTAHLFFNARLAAKTFSGTRWD